MYHVARSQHVIESACAHLPAHTSSEVFAYADLNPTIKDTHWFTSDYFLTASPSERARRPPRGTQPLTGADVSRNLKCKPFIEVCDRVLRACNVCIGVCHTCIDIGRNRLVLIHISVLID